MGRKVTRRKGRGASRGSSKWRKLLLSGLLFIGAVLTASGIQYYREPSSLPAVGEAVAAGEGLVETLPGVAPPKDIVVGRVKRVVDGDTVVVESAGAEEKVRLLNVDSPESVHADPKRNTELGRLASEFTRQRLENAQVRLESNHQEAFDKYGRRLAYLLVDGQNFNVELVRQGWSEYVTKYGKSADYDLQFRMAEAEAKAKKLGIWKDEAKRLALVAE